jgi:hypothetical protein
MDLRRSRRSSSTLGPHCCLPSSTNTRGATCGVRAVRSRMAKICSIVKFASSPTFHPHLGHHRILINSGQTWLQGGSTSSFLLRSQTVGCAAVLLQSPAVVISRVRQPQCGARHAVVVAATCHCGVHGPAQGPDHQHEDQDSLHTGLGWGGDDERGRWERAAPTVGSLLCEFWI